MYPSNTKTSYKASTNSHGWAPDSISIILLTLLNFIPSDIILFHVFANLSDHNLAASIKNASSLNSSFHFIHSSVSDKLYCLVINTYIQLLECVPGIM